MNIHSWQGELNALLLKTTITRVVVIDSYILNTKPLLFGFYALWKFNIRSIEMSDKKSTVDSFLDSVSGKFRGDVADF